GYLLTIGIGSVLAAFRARRPSYTLVLPNVFATLHLSYGSGALLGAAELLLESVFSRKQTPLYMSTRKEAGAGPSR
ncbi:MAG: hypothetical protein ACM369_13885, partial [Acidobacteriota bacterium]